MNVADIGRRPSLGHPIAQRAADLALDDRIRFDDGAQHLCRLANSRRVLIDAALRALPDAHDSTDPVVECARMLLMRAASFLDPPRDDALPAIVGSPIPSIAAATAVPPLQRLPQA